MKDYDFFISKIMYNLIALCGFLIIFMTGVYWGYTFHENNQYFNPSVNEIRFVEYINTKYTYNFVHNEELRYGDELSKRITLVAIGLMLVGTPLLEIGYRGSARYAYKKPFKQRFKEFLARLKSVGET